MTANHDTQVALSIVVPVFERDESLKRAVTSIVSLWAGASIIVVDDGSTEAFAAIADELAATLQAPVEVVHQTNRGPAAARNAGLNMARRPFVMFLDSDDELAETAFPTIEQHVLRRGDVGLLCGSVRVVSPDGAPKIVDPAELPGVPWAKLSQHSGSFVVRTDIAQAVGGYDEALRFGENTDFILRLAERCHRQSLKIVATNDVLSDYHRPADERRYDARRLDAAVHLLKRGRFDLELSSERAKLHAIAAVNAARIGRYRLSITHAALAARTEPRDLRHVARLAAALSGPVARRRWLGKT